MRVVIDEFRKASAPGQPAELREQAEIMLREMEALDLFAQGRHAEAFALLDRAASLQARMPKPIGRPFPVKDVNELYGELLLQVGRAKGGDRPVRSRAGAHAEPQPRAARPRARVSQCRRRQPTPERLTSAF